MSALVPLLGAEGTSSAQYCPQQKNAIFETYERNAFAAPRCSQTDAEF
jgi:hypothetical protein